MLHSKQKSDTSKRQAVSKAIARLTPRTEQERQHLQNLLNEYKNQSNSAQPKQG